jgi:putative spermidine/putrescine transport system substrate-binding protein
MIVRFGSAWRLGAVVTALAFAAAACQGAASPSPTEAPASTTPAPPPSATAPDRPPTYTSWDDVLAAARGTTVNWYMWGGSDTINTNVDNDIGKPVKERFGVTLNRVPIADTADAVNQVLNEAAAGKTVGGSIDLIWINGENFKTLKQANLLYGPWAETLPPNAKYVPWGNGVVDFDFGTPVEGFESPWGKAQFVMEYNTKLVSSPPTTFEALRDWIHANPGLFTYPAIPDFTGSVFVRHVFIWAAGSVDPFLGDFDQPVFDRVAPQVWEYLNDIKPDLWRGGSTYPEAPAMSDLLANGEVAFNMTYDPSRASTNIAKGTYPESIRTFVFDTGTLSNTNYVAIPFNASNPAGAMVIANWILDPEFQLVMTDPDRWGWMTPVDITRWPADVLQTFKSYKTGIATLPADVLAAHALPEPRADWVTKIEQGWIDNVLNR